MRAWSFHTDSPVPAKDLKGLLERQSRADTSPLAKDPDAELASVVTLAIGAASKLATAFEGRRVHASISGGGVIDRLMIAVDAEVEEPAA